MGKSYRPYYPDEDLLLPPSLREWLPENHLAYFVSDVVDHLDLSAMDAVYGEEKRGQPPYDPQMMTKLLLYGYCVGIFQFAPDSAATGGRHRLQGVGSGEPTKLSDHLGFPENPPGDAGRVIRAGAEDHAGSWGREDRAGGAGRDEDEGQRQQTQGHELRPNEREGEAAQRRGEAVTATSRSRRRRRGRAVWQGPRRGRIAR